MRMAYCLLLLPLLDWCEAAHENMQARWMLRAGWMASQDETGSSLPLARSFCVSTTLITITTACFLSMVDTCFESCCHTYPYTSDRLFSSEGQCCASAAQTCMHMAASNSSKPIAIEASLLPGMSASDSVLKLLTIIVSVLQLVSSNAFGLRASWGNHDRQ